MAKINMKKIADTATAFKKSEQERWERSRANKSPDELLSPLGRTLKGMGEVNGARKPSGGSLVDDAPAISPLEQMIARNGFTSPRTEIRASPFDKHTAFVKGLGEKRAMVSPIGQTPIEEPRPNHGVSRYFGENSGTNVSGRGNSLYTANPRTTTAFAGYPRDPHSAKSMYNGRPVHDYSVPRTYGPMPFYDPVKDVSAGVSAAEVGITSLPLGYTDLLSVVNDYNSAKQTNTKYDDWWDKFLTSDYKERNIVADKLKTLQPYMDDMETHRISRFLPDVEQIDKLDDQTIINMGLFDGFSGFDVKKELTQLLKMLPDSTLDEIDQAGGLLKYAEPYRTSWDSPYTSKLGYLVDRYKGLSGTGTFVSTMGNSLTFGAIGLLENLAGNTVEMRDGRKVGSIDYGSANHPIAAAAGNFIGNSLPYGAAGEVLGNTRWINKLPGRFLPKLAASQVADVALHLAPSAIGDAIAGKDAGEIALNAANRFGSDLLMNSGMAVLDIGIENLAEKHAQKKAAGTDVDRIIRNSDYFTQSDVVGTERLTEKMRAWGKELHPDLGGSSDAFVAMRADYDRLLPLVESGAANPSAWAQVKKVVSSWIDNLRGEPKTPQTEILLLQAADIVDDIEIMQAAKPQSVLAPTLQPNSIPQSPLVETNTFGNSQRVAADIIEAPAPRVGNVPELVNEGRPTISTSVSPDVGKPMPQIIQEYQSAVDPKLVDFVKMAQAEPNRMGLTQWNYGLSEASSREIADITKLTNFDITNFEHNLRGDAVIHIDKRHGKHGTADHSMSDLNDIGRIQYVLDNYDTVELLRDQNGDLVKSSHYKNANNTPAPMIVYTKRVNGNYRLVEAVPDTKTKRLQIVSTYKNGANQATSATVSPTGNTQGFDAKAPNTTSETRLPVSSNTSLSQDNPNVNTYPMQNPPNNAQTAGIGNNLADNAGGASDLGQTVSPLEAMQRNALGEPVAAPVTPPADTMVQKALMGTAAEQPQGLRVGKATTIYNPYEGKTPVQSDTISRRVPVISRASLDTATNQIAEARTNALSSGKSFRNYLNDFYNNLFNVDGGRRNIPVNGVTMDGKPYNVTVTRNSIRKVIADPNLSAEKLSVFNNLDEVVQNGVFVGSGNYVVKDGKQKNTDRFDYFETDVNINGTPYVVSYDVEVGGGHNNYRTHKVIQNIDLTPLSGGEVAPVAAAQDNALGLSDTMISQNSPGVNTYSMQNPPNNAQMTGNGNNLADNAGGAAVSEQLVSPLEAMQRSMLGEPATAPGTGVAETTQSQETFKSDHSTEAITEMFNKGKRLERDRNKLLRNSLLTAEDKRYAELVRTGQITPDMVPASRARNNILQLAELGQAMDEAKAPLAAQRVKAREFARDQIEPFIQNPDLITDKKQGMRFQLNTIERNARDIFKEKPELAEQFIRTMADPIHKNEAEVTRVKKKYKTMMGELGLNKGERELAHMFAEKKKTASEIRNTYNNYKIDKAKVIKAAETARQIYDEVFNLVNPIMVNLGYEPIQYRKDYITHFQESELGGFKKFARDVFGIDLSNSELPTDIAGLTDTFKPNKRFNPFAMERTGDKTSYDIYEAINGYLDLVPDMALHAEDVLRWRTLERGIREKYAPDASAKAEKIRNDPTLDVAESAAAIEEVFKQDRTHLSGFVQYVNDVANSLAGKKHRLDRAAERDFGRGVYKLANSIQGRVFGNMVVGNIRSATTNIWGVAQAAAENDMGSFLKAIKDTSRNALRSDGLVEESSFLTNRYEYKHSDLTKSIVDKAGDMLNLMTVPDQIASQIIWRSRFYSELKQGTNRAEAVLQADRHAAAVLADRSKGARPLIFERGSPLIKAVTAFQLEALNSPMYFFKDFTAEAKRRGTKWTVLAVAKYLTGAAMLGWLSEKLFGENTMMDPVGMARNTVDDFMNPDTKNSDAVFAAGERVAQQIPFIGSYLGGGRLPVSAAFPDLGTIASNTTRMATGDIEPDKAGAAIGKELLKPAWYLAPPYGGGQAKKTFEGVGAVMRGGVYGTDGKGKEQLKFPVSNDPVNAMRAAAFGPYATPEGQEYIRGGFKGLSATATESYHQLMKSGIEPQTVLSYIDRIKAIKSTDDEKAIDQKRELLFQAEDLTPQQKRLFDILLVSNNSDNPTKAAADYTDRASFTVSQFSDSAQTLWGHKTVQAALGDENRFAAAYDIIHNTDSVKDEYGNAMANETKQVKLTNIADELDVSPAKAQEIYNQLVVYAHSVDDLTSNQRNTLAAVNKIRRIPDKDYLALINKIKVVESDKDRNGNTISGSKKAKVVGYLRNMITLTPAQRNIILESLGYAPAF